MSDLQEDSGVYYEAANFCNDILAYHDLSSDAKILSIGCGRGWLVYHLRQRGFINAEGCDCNPISLFNSVCNARFGDLLNGLPYPDREFDLIECTGVLSHISSEYLDTAIKELFRVSKNLVWTGILVHQDTPTHKSLIDPDSWAERFMQVGFVPFEIEGLLEAYHFYDDPNQWHQLWEVEQPPEFGLDISIQDRELDRRQVGQRLAHNLQKWDMLERRLRRDGVL